MTERDTGWDDTADTGGQQPADPAKAPGAPSQPPASSDRVFPAWPPLTATPLEGAGGSVAAAPQTPATRAPVPTGTAAQSVPSRRSLRGKPPTSTAGIPVVSAATDAAAVRPVTDSASAVADPAIPVADPATTASGATAQIPRVQAAPATAPALPTWSAVLGADSDDAAADSPTSARLSADAAPAVARPESSSAGLEPPATRFLPPVAQAAPPVAPAESAEDESPSGPADESAQDDEESAAGSPRGRGRLITVVVLAVLVIGAGGTGAWYLMSHNESATEQEVVEAASPTSALQPVARTATTAFATDLPSTVLQYALTGSQDDAEWLAAGALESYLDTYADADGDQLTVHSGQWATEDEARAQQAALAGALTGEVLSSGEVTVSGSAAGAITIVDMGDGTGTAVWSNGTAVFVLTAPMDDVSNAFAAYPV